jgi:hypothetical protein
MCGMAYIDCSGSPFPTRLAVPSEQSCSLSFGSCIPPDTPDLIRSYINQAFAQVFQSVDPSVTDCPSLYTYIRNQPAIGSLMQYNNISTQFDFTPNCVCSVPQGLTTCGSAVTYPVWSLVAALNSTFESAANSAISAVSGALTSAGASCTNCSNQLQDSLCTSFFYRCAPDTSRLFIPPCTNVCNDLLTACRIDQLNTPGILATIRNISSAATAQIITEAVANCTKDPFLPAANADTTTQTDILDPEYHIRRFTSNNSIACHDGYYTPRTRCPCVSADVVGTACEPYLDYQVWQPIKTAVGPYLDSLLTPLDQLDQLCAECGKAAKKAVCQSLLPKCNADTVLQPVCPGDCAYQMSTCNISAIGKQCDKLADNLPFKAADFGSNCFTGGPAVTPACQNCIPLTASATCAPFANWQVFKAASSQFSLIETLMSVVSSTISYPSCSGCDSGMKKLYCSALFVPCSTAVLDRIINNILAGQSFSFTNFGGLFQLVDQPCYSECTATTSGCLTTLAATPTPILTCNTTRVSLFGTTVDFGGPLFSEAPTCYSHNIGPMPPSTCTVLRRPPAGPAPVAAPVSAAPSGGGSTVPTSGDGANVSGGVNPVAIAVPVVLVVLLAVGVVFLIMYLKKVWIFKVHKPDPRMFEG